MSKISVIVPIFNAEKFLDKCIKSILNQTFKEFELILVNDGSTDRSLNICNKYKEEDNRVSVINKKNEGSIITRRSGIESAKSEYIMFVDSDDWIDKDTLKIVWQEQLCSKADIVVFDMYKVVGKLGLIRKKNKKNKYFQDNKVYLDDEIRTNLLEAYFHGHPFPSSMWGKLYKKDYLVSSGNYLNRIKFLGEDLFYNMEVLLKVKRISVINDRLYYYRAGGNTSKYMPYLFEDMINGYCIQKDVIEKYYQDTYKKEKKGISIMLLNTFETCLYNLFLGELTENEIRKKIKYYLNSEELLEAVNNEDSNMYFEKDFITAIKKRDEEYFYKVGLKKYKKNIWKRKLVKICNYI